MTCSSVLLLTTPYREFYKPLSLPCCYHYSLPLPWDARFCLGNVDPVVTANNIIIIVWLKLRVLSQYNLKMDPGVQVLLTLYGILGIERYYYDKRRVPVNGHCVS